MFAACTRRFRTLSSQQRARLQDVQALKTVLGNVDAVALLLRSRPTTDLLRLLSGSDTRVTGDNLPPRQPLCATSTAPRPLGHDTPRCPRFEELNA